jgi:hypothetical protein
MLWLFEQVEQQWLFLLFLSSWFSDELTSAILSMEMLGFTVARFYMLLALLCWSTAWPAVCGDSLWPCVLLHMQQSLCAACVCVAWDLGWNGSARLNLVHILSISFYLLTCQVALPLGLILV